jgi:quercetin dioxygenase-like cupin family protein
MGRNGQEILSPTIARRVIAGDKAMVVQDVLLKGGAVVPEHQHEGEQISYILDGVLLF